MKRVAAMAACLLLLCASLKAQEEQEQHPNSARGFAPEHMYNFSDVDSVSMFNGNLTMHIPIGPKLAVNGMLEYQLGLTYNSNCWDYFYQPDPNGGSVDRLQALPSRRSNAGIGWLFSLGRFVNGGSTPPPRPVATYETPDGGEHGLYTTLHGEPSDGVHLYSRDSTYLRVVYSPTQATVEFPDGRIQTFTLLTMSGDPWLPAAQPAPPQTDLRLTSMKDRFGNELTITYSTTANYQEVWTIAGAGPTPVVAYFETPAQLGLSDPHAKTLLDHVDVPHAGGGAAVRYRFTYDALLTPPGAGDDYAGSDDPNGSPHTIYASFLSGVTLPTGEIYSMTYDTAYSPNQTLTPATPLSMTLPTGETVRWTWEQSDFPEATWGKVDRRTPVPVPSSVLTRQYGGGTWSYTQGLGALYGCNETFDDGDKCPVNQPGCYIGNRQRTVWVTAPDQTTTIAYFSLFRRGIQGRYGSDMCSVLPEGWRSADYALPFTRYCPPNSTEPTCALMNVGGVTRYLSREVRTGFVTPTGWDGSGRMPSTSPTEKAWRSTWVAYDVDSDADSHPHVPQNPRSSATMTFYEEGRTCSGMCPNTAGADYIGSNSYTFDNYGHFKQESLFSNFGTSIRSAFTNYDMTLDNDGHWVLGTWTEQCVREDNATTPPVITACTLAAGQPVTTASFDRATGATTSRRTKYCCDATRDLLAVFERDPADRGNVSREKYFGGDVHSAGGSTPEYEIDHSYTFENSMVKENSSKYKDATFNIGDASFDRYTGLVESSRDTAGLETKYEYDPANRLSAVKPPGKAWTKYSYGNASGTTTPASVDIVQRAYGTADTARALTEKWLYFDSLLSKLAALG